MGSWQAQYKTIYNLVKVVSLPNTYPPPPPPPPRPTPPLPPPPPPPTLSFNRGDDFHDGDMEVPVMYARSGSMSMDSRTGQVKITASEQFHDDVTR